MAWPGAGPGAVARETEPVRADVGQAGGASNDEMGPFLAPLTIARRGMSIGPFACIHIEGQSSQNGGSSPGLLRMGIRGFEQGGGTPVAFTLASVFFARSARSPSIDRYKKQEELARPRSDVKISQARFPGERQRKKLPRTKPREKTALFLEPA